MEMERCRSGPRRRRREHSKLRQVRGNDWIRGGDRRELVGEYLPQAATAAVHRDEVRIGRLLVRVHRCAHLCADGELPVKNSLYDSVAALVVAPRWFWPRGASASRRWRVDGACVEGRGRRMGVVSKIKTSASRTTRADAARGRGGRAGCDGAPRGPRRRSGVRRRDGRAGKRCARRGGAVRWEPSRERTSVGIPRISRRRRAATGVVVTHIAVKRCADGSESSLSQWWARVFKWNRRRELRARWREVSNRGARIGVLSTRDVEGAVSNEKLLELILELNA